MRNHIHKNKFLSNFNLKLVNEQNIQLIFFIKYCNFKGVFKKIKFKQKKTNKQRNGNKTKQNKTRKKQQENDERKKIVEYLKKD